MISFVLKNSGVHLLSTCLYVSGTVLNAFLILSYLGFSCKQSLRKGLRCQVDYWEVIAGSKSERSVGRGRERRQASIKGVLPRFLLWAMETGFCQDLLRSMQNASEIGRLEVNTSSSPSWVESYSWGHDLSCTFCCSGILSWNRCFGAEARKLTMHRWDIYQSEMGLSL